MNQAARMEVSERIRLTPLDTTPILTRVGRDEGPLQREVDSGLADVLQRHK